MSSSAARPSQTAFAGTHGTHLKDLVVVAIAGLLFRFVLLFVAGESTRMTGDTVIYFQLAENLLAGHGFSASEAAPYLPFFGRVPAYPLFIAAVWAIAGKNHMALSVAQIVLDVLTIGLIWFTMNRRYGRWPAVVASGLYALLPFAAGVSLQFMSESLAMFGLAAALACHELAARSSVRGACLGLAFISGLFWGLTTLARPYIAPVVVVVGVVLAYEIGRRANNASLLRWQGVPAIFAVGVGSFLVVGSWTLRNYIAAQETEQPFVLLQVRGTNPPYTNMLTPGWRAWRDSYDEPFYWVDWHRPPKANYLSEEEKASVAKLWEHIAAHDGEVTPKMSEAFAEIAAARYRAAPFRLYVWRPISLALKNWLSPRTSTLRLSVVESETMPVSSRTIVYVFFGFNLILATFALLGWVGAAKTPGAASASLLWTPPVVLTVVLVVIGARETRFNMVVFPSMCMAAGLGMTWALGALRRYHQCRQRPAEGRGEKDVRCSLG
ncbi:MAG: glycosyltransferase family 39 protein [Deltaproteobacteria bacterium]|nr:glycosyltransferase family 39 protein [Deltaproteobacteria bacterium]